MQHKVNQSMDILKYMNIGKKCKTGYFSKYAVINNISTHIDNFSNNNIPVCLNGHKLKLDNNGTYFIHKRKKDLEGPHAIYWYYEMISNYPLTHICLPPINGYSDYCSALLDDVYNSVIKFQYNPIISDTVNRKINYYASHSLNIIWVVYCGRSESITIIDLDGVKKIQFKKHKWVYKGFLNVNNIFLALPNDIIVCINPNDVIDDCVTINNIFNKNDFIESTINNISLWDNKIMKGGKIAHTPFILPNFDINKNYTKQSRQCIKLFASKYGFINNRPIHINNFAIESDINPKCCNNHDLKLNVNKTYFIHKNEADINNVTTSIWHAEFCGNFPYTEICHKNIYEGQTKSRYTDILLKNTNLVVEVQHSIITIKEVLKRTFDYGLHGKSIIWVIDGTNILLIDQLNGVYLANFSKYSWIHTSFVHYEYIFIEFTNGIARITPNNIVNKNLLVSKFYPRDEFIKSLYCNVNIWDNDLSKLEYVIKVAPFIKPENNIFLFGKD